ncbi:hypothetical protein PSPO01_16095 [Paraphaeosphaeria sporulosa]
MSQTRSHRQRTLLTGFETYPDPLISSVKATKGLDAMSPATPATVAQLKSTCDPSSFSQLNAFPSDFQFDTNFKTDFNIGLSPLSDHSRTPSLYGDMPQDASPLTPPPLSPRLELQRESVDSSLKRENFPSNPHKPKRGRPRVARSTASLFTTSSIQSQRAQRLPHNQVERKYREGLNASLERLRKTVPALCQDDDLRGLLAHARPSKAMILEGAIEYIKAIEEERDMYRDEIERLRRNAGGES